MRLGARLRAYFLAGILVTAPVSITIYLTWLFITFVDERVAALVPPRYYPGTYLPFGGPGVGVLIAVLTLILVGWLTAGYLGALLASLQDRLLTRMPVIRSVYSAVKQIFETLLANQSTAFREVVLIEWPRPEMWTVGFITSIPQGELQSVSAETLITVFVPMTPFPTGGFIAWVPKSKVVLLEMKVEDALKIVMSGGIVLPPPRDGTERPERSAVEQRPVAEPEVIEP